MAIAKSVIIAVEDDPRFGQMYREVAEEIDVACYIAADGESGLQLIKEHLPKLVLLDVMLGGGMNGFDVLEAMKRNDELKNIPVIMLTNLDSEEKVAKQIGANEYIVKVQVSLDQLKEKIAKYL